MKFCTINIQKKPLMLLLMILSLSGFIISIPSVLYANEHTAEEIMHKVDHRYDGNSSIAEITMILIDRRESQRIRDLKMYSKDYGLDTKTLSLFESPADIRGTSYLNFDWDDSQRDDDSWLYLPSLQRVKRIASSDTSDSFLGSDFTYADINGIEIDWYNYNFISESEIVNDEECWVIEITPKPGFKERAEEATGYSKMHSWISKDKLLQMQAQAWELRSNRIKFFTSSEIEKIDGIWTIKKLQAITTKNNRKEHASILKINSVKYNVDVDDGLLTTESMQRGLE